jgi:hypothetical protein
MFPFLRELSPAERELLLHCAKGVRDLGIVESVDYDNRLVHVQLSNGYRLEIKLQTGHKRRRGHG